MKAKEVLSIIGVGLYVAGSPPKISFFKVFRLSHKLYLMASYHEPFWQKINIMANKSKGVKIKVFSIAVHRMYPSLFKKTVLRCFHICMEFQNIHSLYLC